MKILNSLCLKRLDRWSHQTGGGIDRTGTSGPVLLVNSNNRRLSVLPQHCLHLELSSSDAEVRVREEEENEEELVVLDPDL
ncbi:coiled-coil domain-containing protein 40-like [Myxocyprinus asiaticus]|uniref:coiled-coil domain-containing protein 40-like n=1 Tax=Myxocyprinus asiaticus TaxID=70543 RepID=UPI002222D22B|nr:coiled-coil domain-containing protein 40-like [Myxocyprinus asiaticus]